MKTKCHRIFTEDSQNLQRYNHTIYAYVHLYNSNELRCRVREILLRVEKLRPVLKRTEQGKSTVKICFICTVVSNVNKVVNCFVGVFNLCNCVVGYYYIIEYYLKSIFACISSNIFPTSPRNVVLVHMT